MKYSLKKTFLLCILVVFTLAITGCKNNVSDVTGNKSTAKSDVKPTTQKASSTSKTSEKNTTAKDNTTDPDDSSDNNSGDDQSEDQTSSENGNDNDDNSDNGSDDGDAQSMPKYNYDFGGRTIRIGTLVGKNAGNYAVYPADADGFPYVYGTDPNTDRLWDYAREIEKKFNCKLIVKPVNTSQPASHEQFTQEVLSGVCDLDIFNTRLLFSKPIFMLNNLILPISDYIDFDNGDPRFDNSVIKLWAGYKGKYWGIPTWVPNNLGGLVYNLDIRDKEGLEDPVEVAMSGNWNWEKFVEILKNATRDFNGDGIIDQWGYACWGPAPAPGFIAANGGTIVEEIDGKYKFTVDSEPALKALTFISDLYNTHKVAINDSTLWKKGTVFMDYVNQFFAANIPSRYTSIGIRFRVIGYPVGPDNPSGKVIMNSDSQIYYIPATAEDPKGIAYLMASLFRTYTDPGMIEENDIILENNLDTRYGDDTVQKDYLRKHYLNVDGSRVNYGVWGTPFTEVHNFINSTMLKSVSDGVTPIVPFIESVRPLIQADIDNTARQ